MKVISNFLEKYLQPIAGAISSNQLIQSISEGMLATVPITVGTSLIAILVNLPIDSWQNFLVSTGLYGPATDLVAVTSSMLAIYIVITVSYSIAKNKGKNSLVATILSVAVFLSQMPRSVTVGGETVNALLVNNLGSRGIFVAIIIGTLVSLLYCFLVDKGIGIKLPETVPTNVSQYLSPMIIAIIIITLSFLVKYGLSLTSYGDIFTLLETYLTKPALLFGTSMWSAMIFGILRAIFWFFGIHPTPLNAVFTPLYTAALAANTEAFLSGTAVTDLPSLGFIVVYTFIMIGGTGNTLGLLGLLFTAKSDQYKALAKIAVGPGLFNINEPLVFGVPLMLNPTYFIPLILTSVVSGIVSWVFIEFKLLTSFNAALDVAWVLPNPIGAFLRGGLMMLLLSIIIIVLQTIVWYPFFKIEDNRLYKAEKERLAELNKN